MRDGVEGGGGEERVWLGGVVWGEGGADEGVGVGGGGGGWGAVDVWGWVSGLEGGGRGMECTYRGGSRGRGLLMAFLGGVVVVGF